ncbi:tobH domain protein [Mycobacterium xenopi 4042]|uniref:TobH domain protein n=1 Tax=Mycobacterium xenopi 4042 TaxID=1299334 RepID=X8DCH2_MYCXE|nr:tobH domain protein [Mycobacterium xenopi 4042]
MLAAAVGGSCGEPIVVTAEAPSWIGALDVLIVAGDDPAILRWSGLRRPGCAAARGWSSRRL